MTQAHKDARPSNRAARNVRRAPITSPAKLARVEEVRRALALRLGGGTFQDIATALNIRSPEKARQLVMEGLQEAQNDIRKNAGMYLAEESMRVERLMRAVWPLAVGQPARVDQAGAPIAAVPADLKAVDRAVKLMERKARLLGLDAPQRHQFGVEDEGGNAADDARQAIMGKLFEGAGTEGSLADPANPDGRTGDDPSP
jgi:hypothetical protein